MTLLDIHGLSKSYDGVPALDKVSLSLEPGKITGLLGPNGQGKSTLIKLINGLLKPDAGEILFEGHPISIQDRQDISYLPERTYLDTSWKVSQVLDLFADFYVNFDRQKAEKLLADLHLDPHVKIRTMSKGMQEKLQLVLVMSRKARLYILDEPLGGVDPASRDYILDTILSNFDEGASVLISTHLISDIERILDNVVMIQGGKIILQEEADVLREQEQASIDTLFRRRFKC